MYICLYIYIYIYMYVYIYIEIYIYIYNPDDAWDPKDTGVTEQVAKKFAGCPELVWGL